MQNLLTLPMIWVFWRMCCRRHFEETDSHLTIPLISKRQISMVLIFDTVAHFWFRRLDISISVSGLYWKT